jgi:hypothetical protein
MITVGMRSRDGDPDKGIFWSLPLAHMRFYGGVVKTERRTSQKESQITYAGFQYVILGSVVSSWGLESENLE